MQKTKVTAVIAFEAAEALVNQMKIVQKCNATELEGVSKKMNETVKRVKTLRKSGLIKYD